MADYNAGSLTGNTNYNPDGGLNDGSSPAQDLSGAGGGAVLVKYYQMAWRDVDPGPTTTRIWTAAGAPDPTGAAYTGPKNGTTPISGATVVAYWTK